jgi:hypothetical protein
MTTLIVAASAAPAQIEQPRAPAAYGEQDEPLLTEGLVSRVDMDNHVFSIANMDAGILTFAVNDDTTYVIDGEEATAQDVLTDDTRVKVTHKNNIALKVEAISDQ